MSTNTADLTNYHPPSPTHEPKDYSDIIHCKRPQAPNPMNIKDRAAQFSPYAALVGHKDIIAEDESIANDKNDINHDIIVVYDE